METTEVDSVIAQNYHLQLLKMDSSIHILSEINNKLYIHKHRYIVIYSCLYYLWLTAYIIVVNYISTGLSATGLLQE